MTFLDGVGAGAIATSAGGLWILQGPGDGIATIDALISPSTAATVSAIATAFFGFLGTAATAYFAYKARQPPPAPAPPPAPPSPPIDPDTEKDDPSQEAR